jgi:formamidopyrimidine-DNA glycosylase
VPELPDIEAYLHALRPRVVDAAVEAVRISSPSWSAASSRRLRQSSVVA